MKGLISINSNNKKRISKQNKILALTTVIFIVGYILINISSGLLDSFIDGAFVIGIIYIGMGMAIYIRNVGLFKTYKYLAYKIKAGAYDKKKIGQVELMSLAEFADKSLHNVNRSSGKHYYLWGIPLVVISYVLVFVF